MHRENSRGVPNDGNRNAIATIMQAQSSFLTGREFLYAGAALGNAQFPQGCSIAWGVKGGTLCVFWNSERRRLYDKELVRAPN